MNKKILKKLFSFILYITQLNNKFNNITHNNVLCTIYNNFFTKFTYRLCFELMFLWVFNINLFFYRYKNLTNKKLKKTLFIKKIYLYIDSDNNTKCVCNKCSMMLHLTNIIIDTKIISPQMFSYCLNLKKVYLLNTQVIKSNAFENCISLEKIYIPKTIKHIEILAFNNCINLKSIIFY